MTLFEHLESFLGTVRGGWTTDANGEQLPFQVVWFADAPEPGVITYVTLGLSRHVLDGTTHGIRQELLVAARGTSPDHRLLGFLVAVGEHALESGRALLRGDAVPPRDSIVDGSSVRAGFVTGPAWFPDGFARYDGSRPPTVFAWLIPITASEADLVASHGWVWFEEQLDTQRIDVFDLFRAEVPHGGA